VDEARTCEVAVVGASPAGLAAAHAAASHGLDVVLLEAGTVGEPEPPAVVGFEAIWPDAWAPPEAAIRSRFGTVEVGLPGDHPVRVQAPGRVVDRTRLDRWAAERARRAGAEIRTETGPWEVREPGHLAGPAGRVQAEVVVFADGAGSIASAIVDPVEAPEQLVWGVTHELELGVPSDPLAIRVGDHAPGGRTQLVPIDASTTWHWTFARCPREQAIEQAERALAWTARRRGWPEEVVADARRLHVAPDPTLQRPARLAGPGTLVAGGAGGLGGLEAGLSTGQEAGRAAARAVVAEASPEEPLQAYARACRRRFAPAYRGLERLFALAERVPDRLLAALARPQADRELELDEVAGLVAEGTARWSTLAELTLEGLASKARAKLPGLN
jgi:flavin-dependent dehydrogenase